MKFTDGQWLLQPGVAAHFASEAHEVRVHDDRVVVLATTRPIKHRGDTLGGPTLTVTLSSPMEGVIRVSVEHFSASQPRRLHVPMPGAGRPVVRIEETPADVTLASGALSVTVRRGEGWSLVFREGGRVLTRSDWRSLGYVQWAGKGSFLHEQLALQVGELVYGLGERFTPFVKNGQVVENTNKDGGTACEQAYKSVPFYLSSRGYGVLVNEAGPVSFEVASEKTARVQFSREGESLDYCVVAGPTPKGVLQRLTALTGRAPLPPAWSFGLWMTTSFTTQYDEATATHFIDEMKRRELPLAVFHFDCFWMREFQWCDFEWDPQAFPDPEGMLARLHERGLRISLWINPYVAQKSPLFQEAAQKGYFIRRAGAEPGLAWQTDLWQPGMAIVDFTNPAAVAWYQGHLRRLVAMGVDCFKTDFGERIPEQGVAYHDGSDPVEMHNLYPLLYNQAVFEVLQQTRGAEAVLFARSSYASGQRFPVHWGGDCWSNFESMAESLRGGLSLTSCGFAFWSHDIGGFEGNPPPAVYKRWIQFGLLSSHSRLHGSSSYRVPWLVDEESCEVLRRFTRLKHQLMPYLYAKAIEACETGVPVMRSMLVEHPQDPACATLDRQYHLGESLLVAPVFTESGEVDVYLPEGRWTSLLSGEVREGGRWYRETHGFLSLPLYVAANTVLPWGAEAGRPDYDYASGVTLRVFALDDGAAAPFSVAAPDGTIAARGSVRREGARYVAVVTEGGLRRWRREAGGRQGELQEAAGECSRTVG